MGENFCIINVFLNDRNVERQNSEASHDKKVAIFDLIEENYFKLTDDLEGPYNLHLRTRENRLEFGVCDQSDSFIRDFSLPISNFRSIIKDYFVICDSYYNAVKSTSPSRIEAIDMGRRGLHNEGSELLRERLKPFAEIDLETARRLFTLICVLHRR